MSEQQYIATYELEHRIWTALDALSTGTYTADDISLIRYCTGIDYRPPNRVGHDTKNDR
jgi:hypothetical protein